MSIEVRHNMIAESMISSIGGGQFGLFNWNGVKNLARSTAADGGQVRAARLIAALETKGYKVLGRPESTRPDRYFWIYRTGSQTEHLFNVVTSPDGDSARELARAITKLNGRWDWGSTTSPSQVA